MRHIYESTAQTGPQATAKRSKASENIRSRDIAPSFPFVAVSGPCCTMEDISEKKHDW
jgi:hypothetical protein